MLHQVRAEFRPVTSAAPARPAGPNDWRIAQPCTMMRANHRNHFTLGDPVSSPSPERAPKPSLSGQIMQLASGYMPVACLYAAAKLKIADLLAAGPGPVAELALASHVN